MRSVFIIAVLFYLIPVAAFPQAGIKALKEMVAALSSPNMKGRGYTGGGDSAAFFVQKEFSDAGLTTFKGAPGFFQPYFFPVNIFPHEITLRINDKPMRPGIDFMVHPSSKSANIRGDKIAIVDIDEIKTSKAWKKQKRRFKADGVYCLKHIHALKLFQDFTIRKLSNDLRKGFFLVPLPGKLSWLASSEKTSATIIYLADSILPATINSVEASIQKSFEPRFATQNVIGYVPGTKVPDSFLVITAHYDHLGQMGPSVMFPGASDNASGVALMLMLARYYADHPQLYSMVFMAFSGEEAMLKGSSYYARHPLFPLRQIRFLLNLDITGDATNGITIVNALANRRETDLLDSINTVNKYLPSIGRRDQTKNSDHYPFAKKGFPAVYLYSNGLKPYYHDINDKYEELSFRNVDKLLAALKDFLLAIQ